MDKKKREKAEDFIGWKSGDGLLEVIELLEKSNNSKFKVICHKCKEDKELFPDSYFVCTKSSLIKGSKPCGCSKSPKWNKEQYLILTRRTGEGRFIVNGFAEEFHGAHTKLNLECLIDGHKWSACVYNIINSGNGCRVCATKANADAQRTDEQEALDKCRSICEIEGYKPIGFVGNYINNKTRFEYKCPTHGKQNVSYDRFVNSGSRCRGCSKDRQKENGNGNGYYPERKNEQDFLYVLDFDSKFIKVGRSFDVDERIKSLRSLSKIKKIHKLRIFTASHQEIYDLEQDLHNELRERNFQYPVKWSKECFENDCLFILNKLLNNCDFEEIEI